MLIVMCILCCLVGVGIIKLAVEELLTEWRWLLYLLLAVAFFMFTRTEAFRTILKYGLIALVVVIIVGVIRSYNRYARGQRDEDGYDGYDDYDDYSGR